MQYDVIGFGSVIVDILARVEDSFFENTPFTKGKYAHLSARDATYYIQKLPNKLILPGGSAANTIACASALGLKTGFVGSLRNDTLGHLFMNEFNRFHVDFLASPRVTGEATGQSLILVTPDGDRSMNTYLGIAPYVTPDDIKESFIEHTRIFYTEAYLWEPDLSKDALLKTAELCQKHQKKFAFCLSDQFYMQRHAAAMRPFVADYVDILFGNMEELEALTCQKGQEALKAIQKIVPFSAITDGAIGSYLVTEDSITFIKRHAVDKIVDTTGAGDAYAGGILYGLVKKMSLFDQGTLASRVASDIITHLGSRPQNTFEQFINTFSVKETKAW